MFPFRLGREICWMALGLTVAPMVRADPVSREAAYEGLAPARVAGSGPVPEGIAGRVLCGYQGWFRAEGDGSGLGFTHYQRAGKFEPGFCAIDLWPDLSGFDPGECYATPFVFPDGRPAPVFSSLHPKTVDRHYRWMREHGIDGTFVQRFAVHGAQIHGDHAALAADNRKLALCRDAANAHGRCWALMYDLSGLAAADFERLAADWKELRARMELGTDPKDRAYLRYRGKPLVAVWGIGFNDGRSYGLENCEWFLRFLKHNPEWGGVSLMVGVPYGWRTLDRDCAPDPRLHEVLKLADVISPWSVGRYRNREEVGAIAAATLRQDLAWCGERGISYLPVVFPGFSWHNLRAGEAPLNAIPREGGRFLWKQFTTIKGAGAVGAYVAMFDEIDEATAIIPCRNAPPAGASPFVSYEGVSGDHYLWLCGEGGRLLREELPSR
ncbi:MAG: xylosidase/arabinosidase [Verrucomicrobia bacterium]|nr:xylosidase/arabinosidase [Verrucomicrobiota bacterium]